MAKKLKIRLSITIEVDPDRWADLNGLTTSAEVREDIKAYVWSSLWGLPMIEDTEADLTWKR